MVKLEFENAVAEDTGYGLRVNGKELSEIISIALGTRLGYNYGLNSGLPNFKSNCCNITVLIDPQPVSVKIEDDEYEYGSVEEMEAERREQFEQKTQESNTEK